MSLPLEGKIALVTGSSRGIGRAIADRLVANGAAVAINYTGSRQTPEEVADVSAFLASDAARWVTGQNVQAGGGVV